MLLLCLLCLLSCSCSWFLGFLNALRVLVLPAPLVTSVFTQRFDPSSCSCPALPCLLPLVLPAWSLSRRRVLRGCCVFFELQIDAGELEGMFAEDFAKVWCAPWSFSFPFSRCAVVGFVLFLYRCDSCGILWYIATDVKAGASGDAAGTT